MTVGYVYLYTWNRIIIINMLFVNGSQIHNKANAHSECHKQTIVQNCSHRMMCEVMTVNRNRKEFPYTGMEIPFYFIWISWTCETNTVCKQMHNNEWVSDYRVLRPPRHTIAIGHFGDESFQAFTCTGSTDNSKQTSENTPKHRGTDPTFGFGGRMQVEHRRRDRQ